MKLTLKYVFVTLFLLPLIFYFSLNFSTSKANASSKAANTFIKCTSSKFLLEDIDSTQQIAPIFKNLGKLHYDISTKIALTQVFFNQGLKLTYGFNHAEAHRSFLEASRLDPNAAMPYWGQAYTLGPNINDPQPDEERKIKSIEAIAKAKKLAMNASPKEKALIDALTHRYSENLETDVATLNLAYMHAMKAVADTYPEDANILTLYAASVMNTVPWSYWDKEGNPAPFIIEAKLALENAIKIDPENPGAHHYYIHLVELPFPDLGVISADKLGSLMPGAGHMVHMPSHIYIRVGRYKDAVTVNQTAILADEDYISQCYAQGMYPLGYYPHNIHFLWSASSLLGNSEIAIDAARKVAEKVPVGELTNLPFLQDFASTPLLAYTRFGKWNDILTFPSPNNQIKHLQIIRHYARGIAFVRKKNSKDALEELQAISEMQKDTTLASLYTNMSNTSSIASIAYEVLAGEIENSLGNNSKAIEHLKKAVSLEDQLQYNEPTSWHIPPRQNLGAVLLQHKKYKEAMEIFHEDLKENRQNGWSLMGLYQALTGLGKTVEANKIKLEFDLVWQYADIAITTSVL